MPRHTQTVVALAAAVMAIGASDARATAKPCQAPASGFQSCLRVLYQTGADGSVKDARVTATLLRRVDACPARIGRREVVISRDGQPLDAVRRPGSCRRGVITWRTAFSARDTAGWSLRKGDTIESAWSGVRNASAVTLSG